MVAWFRVGSKAYRHRADGREGCPQPLPEISVAEQLPGDFPSDPSGSLWVYGNP